MPPSLSRLTAIGYRKILASGDGCAGQSAYPREQVTARTLIVQGTEDIQVSYARARDMASSLAKRPLSCRGWGPRAMPRTHQEELQTAMAAFLAEISERERGKEAE